MGCGVLTEQAEMDDSGGLIRICGGNAACRKKSLLPIADEIWQGDSAG